MANHLEGESLPLERAALGALLSFGSPIGWLMLEWLGGTPVTEALKSNPGVYIYMTLGTLVVFTLFGYALGHQEKKLFGLSIRDSLTGLYNPRFFHERLPAAFAQAARDKRPIALLQMDLDHFKQVNDQFGHKAGDIVLREVGEVIQQATRKGETAARVGGEEFCIILDGADAAAARTAAERFQQALRSARIIIPGGQQLPVTASIGVASSADSRGDEWTLHAAADTAMYQAKRDGRDCVRMADVSQE